MKSGIPRDIPNVIKDMLESMGLPMKEGQGLAIRDDPKIQRIWLIYNLADKDTKRFLDALMTELCGKSLKDLLKDSDKQKKPQS
jgi:hypothetical protein